MNKKWWHKFLYGTNGKFADIMVIIAILLCFFMVSYVGINLTVNARHNKPVLVDLTIGENKTPVIDSVKERQTFSDSVEVRFKRHNLNVFIYLLGQQKETLVLNCVFFNEYTGPLLEAAGFFESAKKLGFKKIAIFDGYNYHKNWKLSQ